MTIVLDHTIVPVKDQAEADEYERVFQRIKEAGIT